MKRIKLFLLIIICYMIFNTLNVYALKDKILEVDQNTFFVLILILFALFTSILLFIIYGRDEKFTETIEFYPPEGYNSLEVGFLYKGKATSIDVISLLIYLASLKYLKISDIEEKTISVNTNDGISIMNITDFKITKLKEYDGNNENEKIFFNGLFENSKTGNEITCMELYDKFYETKNLILQNMNTKDNKQKIFNKNSLVVKNIIGILAFITYFIVIFYPLFNEHILIDYIPRLPILILPVFILYFIINIIFEKKDVVPKKEIMINKFIAKTFAIIILIIFLNITLGMGIMSVLVSKKTYLFVFYFGMLSVALMFICFRYALKRNKYGNEILGKIEGFKTFLKTAEKNNIEKIVEKNPDYCYKILPYTYVLGVESKWIENFDSLFTLDSMKGFFELNLDEIFGNNSIYNFMNSKFDNNIKTRR